MNDRKVEIIKPLFLCLVFLSTVINILFYNDIVSKLSMEIGFILVILCSIVTNILLMKNGNLNKDNAVSTSRFRKVILLIVGIVWFITYIMALNMK